MIKEKGHVYWGLSARMNHAYWLMTKEDEGIRLEYNGERLPGPTFEAGVFYDRNHYEDTSIELIDEGQSRELIKLIMKSRIVWR